MSRGPYYNPGRYWGKVMSQAMGITKTEKPQFILTFVVMGKIDPANPDGELLACEQYERSIFRVITEKTVDYLMEDLVKLQFDGESFAMLDPKTEGFCNFKGRELAFYCKHENDETGTMREKWGIAREGGGMQVKPLEAQGMRKLDALYGKHLKGKAKPTLPAKPSAAPAKDPNDDFQEALNASAGAEDIPF